ncbi:MAG: ATP-grasp domain-containing protein, partial [Oscillospiraceae bacterium]|nr:ATP-grasp domain-containing protein [Oscillospiraceae bacterium]
PTQDIPASYRGWMMKPEQYALFYQELRKQHICLMTSPEAYQKFHLFPLIYPEIQKDTARILVYPDGIVVNLAQVKENFSKFLVKDYVKSAKGSGFPDFFNASVTQEEFDRAMTIFYRDRADLYTGGICIKEFLELKRYHNFTNEYRVFVANHRIAGIYKNSHQPEQAQTFPVELIRDYLELDSPFYTLDCAELADGTWKIIETGDGQVSGLPDEICPVDFFRMLRQCFQG